MSISRRCQRLLGYVYDIYMTSFAFKKQLFMNLAANELISYNIS